MIVHFINLNNFLEREYFPKFCLESWKKYMPDLEIKIWTEKDEFIQKTLNKNSKFLKFFQKDKNYSLLCDYLRINIQYEFGGIYSELDQMLLKPLKINENIEFCHSITMAKSITTSFKPNYFKKGNKILKYLIDELDNNFKEYWLDNSSNIKKPPFYGYSEWSLCALRNYASMIELISELKSNSIKFDKENGDWCLHLSDWWFYKYDIIFLIDYNQIENYRVENMKNTLYIIFYKNFFEFNNLQNIECKFIGLEQKDIFLKFLKYKIYKSPELKNKFFDTANYLGNLDNLSKKDFEININDI